MWDLSSLVHDNGSAVPCQHFILYISWRLVWCRLSPFSPHSVAKEIVALSRFGRSLFVMAIDPAERPPMETLPGIWPSASANGFRQQYLTTVSPGTPSQHQTGPGTDQALPAVNGSATSVAGNLPVSTIDTEAPSRTSSDGTAVLSNVDSKSAAVATLIGMEPKCHRAPSLQLNEDEDIEEVGGFEPIKILHSKDASKRPIVARKMSSTVTEDELFRVLSRKRTNQSGRQGTYVPSGEEEEEEEEEQAEIERLMSRMFGKGRQGQSEEEKTRHIGLVFKNVTVKGMGLGAALQPTLSDPS